MSVFDQCVTDEFAIYNGDCVEVMKDMPEGCVHLSIYSPPFGGLYNYSSNERDLSNCDDYDTFFEHYTFVIRELARVTMPGRITAVHCMDIPLSNSGTDAMRDFPGDVIKMHCRCVKLNCTAPASIRERGECGHGEWRYTGRRMIWKEPLAVRLRTMQKNLAHASLVADSIDCGVASGDQLLTFRRVGKNPVPVQHPVGMLEYAGERTPPADVLQYRGWTGKQTENRFSHWIWRQYADCMWDDIRIKRVLPYREARDSEDEKHVHPLQLDVIDRCVELFSNKGETVFSPFMGVGSEIYSPILLGRRGMGAELKPSYYRQALKNVSLAVAGRREMENNQPSDLVDEAEAETMDA